MNEILLFIADFTPYVVAALLCGLTAAVASPWLWKHPERWLFLAIFALSVPDIGDGTGDGSMIKQVSWSTLFALGFIHVVRNARGHLTFDRKDLPLALAVLIGFTGISVLWSPYRMTSLVRLIQVIGVLFIALMVARNALAGRGLLTQAMVPARLFLLLGFAVAVISPGTAFDAEGCMNGIASHKNTWGQFSLLTGLIHLSALSERRNARQTLLIVAMLGLSAISIVLSRSTTSLLCFLFITGTLMLWAILTRGGIAGKLLIAGLVATLLVALHVYFVAYGELPFEALRKLVYSSTGKNESLTGRDFLWYLIQQEISHHPWLGTGYGGFWTGTEGPSAALVARLDWGPPTQSHNGYLEVVNEIGFVGMGLLVVALIAQAANVVRLSQRGEYQHAFFFGSVLIAMVFINYAESSFLRTTQFWWIALCISIVEAHVRLRHAPEAERLKAQAMASQPSRQGRLSLG